MSCPGILRDLSDPQFDPFTAYSTVGQTGGIADIHEEFARLRSISPVHELDIRQHMGGLPDQTMIGLRKWTVFGYDDVVNILGDGERFSTRIYENNLKVAFGKTFTMMDGKEHRKWRLFFQSALSPRLMNRWGEQIIPAIADELIDRFARRGTAELVGEFCQVFAFNFIHEFLNLPYEDRALFLKLAMSQTLVRIAPEQGREAGEILSAYLEDLLQRRAATNTDNDDFIDSLCKAQVDGEQVPPEIIVAFLRQLMNAGGDTVYHGLATTLAVLLSHPRQMDAVRDDRSLLPQAIDEALRWEAPTMMVDRTPAAPVELGGHRMAPGDQISVVIGAANRDPAAFADPDRFDIHAKRNSLSFGYGPHMCFGRHLTRMEIGTALNRLFDRLPGLRLDPAYSPPVITGVMIRAPQAIHVRFDD